MCTPVPTTTWVTCGDGNGDRTDVVCVYCM